MVRHRIGGDLVDENNPLQVSNPDGSLVGSGNALGTGTEYVEDAGVPGTPHGPTILYEREDTPSETGAGEGDWQHPKVNARGSQWVDLDPAGAAVSALATQSTLQYLVDTVGNTNDAEEDDPTQTASVIALLKGILAKPSGGSGSTAIPTDALGYQQSCVGGTAIATASGPCRIGYVVTNYDAPVSVTVSIIKPSDLGSAFDAIFRQKVLTNQQDYIWFPSEELHIKNGDTLVVTAPGVTSQVASVAIYGQDETP